MTPFPPWLAAHMDAVGGWLAAHRGAIGIVAAGIVWTLVVFAIGWVEGWAGHARRMTRLNDDLRDSIERLNKMLSWLKPRHDPKTGRFVGRKG